MAFNKGGNQNNYGAGANLDASGFAGSNDAPGGFMASPGGGSPSADSPSKGKGNRSSSQSLLPVTVRQLSTASPIQEDQFRIDGHELNQVTIVGAIIAKHPNPTNINLKIDDGTGAIDVRIWMDSDASDYNSKRQHEWKEGTYVRVFGHLRSFMNQKSIVAFRVIPLTDFNELTYHLLEVIYVHLYNTRGPLQNTTGQPQATFFQGGGYGAQPNVGHNQQQQYVSNKTLGGNHMTDLQRAVFGAIKADPNNTPGGTGASVRDVANRLRNMANAQDVRGAIEFLANEGLLYSTIDEEHFASTE